MVYTLLESAGIFYQTSLALDGQGMYILWDDDMENRGSIG